MESTTCPICLEFIDTADASNFLSVPGCQHKMHVACALECAHHGTRCPVCRHEFIQENAAPEPDAENNILFRFEQELQERAASYRVYQMRRSRLIRRRNSLKKLRDRLRDANRSYAEADRILDKEWTKAVKTAWMTDPKVCEAKLKRKRCQDRRNRYDRQLRNRLEPMIGAEPSMQAPVYI